MLINEMILCSVNATNYEAFSIKKGSIVSISLENAFSLRLPHFVFFCELFHDLLSLPVYLKCLVEIILELSQIFPSFLLCSLSLICEFVYLEIFFQHIDCVQLFIQTCDLLLRKVLDLQQIESIVFFFIFQKRLQKSLISSVPHNSVEMA